MPIIKAKKVPSKTESVEDILALFCYHFPQYTFQAARRIPNKRIRQMLRVAKREQAVFLHHLTGIASAPHTKKGSGVKKMLKYFRDIIEN